MYLFLVVIAFVSLFPFFWMVVSSTNTTADINREDVFRYCTD